MTAHVGTAGYSYPAWAPGFYPPGLPAAEQLAYYARHFSCVEINSTFYRVPTADQLLRMAARVPDGFQFMLKIPKSVSHDFDIAELPAFHSAAQSLESVGKLGGLLLQEPETFRNTAGNRAWLIRVRELLGALPIAVEFRHASWATPEPEIWAKRHGYTVAAVGVPDLPQLFPAGLRATAGRVYARLHSENPDAWYAGGEARYDYDYSEIALRTWADGLIRVAESGVRESWLFFNNCVGIQAVTNATRLMAMLREGGMAVAGAVGPALRPTLFDGWE